VEAADMAEAAAGESTFEESSGWRGPQCTPIFPAVCARHDTQPNDTTRHTNHRKRCRE
jgi:hypothetical protein